MKPQITKTPTGEAFESLLTRAVAAGHSAAGRIDLSKIADGQGWVSIKLGKKSKKTDFAKWYLKYTNDKEDDYYGVAVKIPMLAENPFHGICKKEAFAEAFAKVIREAGYTAWPVTYLT